MSNVSRGILFYGYVEPTDDKNGDWRPAFDNYWGDDYKRFSQAAKELGVEFGQCGHYEYSTYHIRLADPYKVTWNDNVIVTPDEMAELVTPKRVKDLQTFAEMLGINLEGLTPAWYLGASYG